MFNETSYSTGFSDAVVSGQSLYWAGTVNNVAGAWSSAVSDFQFKLSGEGFSPSLETNESSGSLAANVIAPGSFGDSNDVKALIDGIANEAGFRLRASMITPGAKPLQTSTGAPTSLFDLPSAASWWGSGLSSLGNSLTGALNVDSNTLMIGALVIGGLLLFSMMKK
jgi:hypothetical protein